MNNKATPPQEIQQQHDEACSLLTTMPYADRRNFGEIPLSQKEHPTCETNEEKKEDQPSICFSSRGQVDVTLLQDLVREGYNEPILEQTSEQTATSTAKKSCTDFSITNLWDEANAAINNVAVTRPSHDAWGIKKIVLVFCDDFLQDVFVLPWWLKFQSALRPLWDCLGLPADRAVRLLLAALPPGVTIPIHHDTGEWVRHTHRVHVPILVSEPHKILFRCGLTPSCLQRIDCTPGHVFEMNNQAKHAVSNGGTDHRVHLILDYIDPDFVIKRRILLQPGERLYQTRRSIDRLSERGSRPTPTYLILGAQKAGTTSLYEYIIQHPLVAPARRRETHCLDWRWNDKAKSTKARRLHCLKFFYAKELELHPSVLTGDSTPSYLLDSRRVIPRLKEVFPHEVKFFVTMREPVARAFSQYQMVTSTEGTPEQLKNRGFEWRGMSFREVVRKEMEALKECGLIPYWDIEQGTMDPKVFESFFGSKEEDAAYDRFLQSIPLLTGSHSLIVRGLYALQLRPWFKFFPRNRFLVIKLEDMQNVMAVMENVWEHLNLPHYTVEDASVKNSREYDPVEDDIRDYLRRFFAPHNHALSQLLDVATWRYD